MRIKPLLFLIGAVLVISLIFSSCRAAGEQYEAHMKIDVMTDENGKTITRRNGTEVNSFEVNDTPMRLDFSIGKSSGSIGITVCREENEKDCVYEGHDIALTDFTVTVRDKGRYRIMFTCENFVGTYGVSYVSEA